MKPEKTDGQDAPDFRDTLDWRHPVGVEGVRTDEHIAHEIETVRN